MRLEDESANTTDSETESQAQPPIRCQCLPGCSELRYRGTLSSAPMTGNFTLNKDYAAKNETYFRFDRYTFYFV
jgi:hypothetical protein